jgi:hypothetical protein
MPRILRNRVTDSNTGVVIKAPFHSALCACVVVNDGSKVNCDERVLDHIVGLDREPWRKMCPFVCTIPTYRMTDEEKRDLVYQQALAGMAAHIGETAAAAQLEMTLGWCTDSLDCAECGLMVPGHFAIGAFRAAKALKWGLNLAGMPVCPAHKPRLPLWTEEEFIAIESSEVARSANAQQSGASEPPEKSGNA